MSETQSLCSSEVTRKIRPQMARSWGGTCPSAP